MGEEERTYVCDNCGREVDEAEAYIDEGVLCPDCYLDSLGGRRRMIRPIDWQARAESAEAELKELRTLFHFQAGQLCKLGGDVDLLLRDVDRSSEPIRDERVIERLNKLREKVSLREVKPEGAGT